MTRLLAKLKWGFVAFAMLAPVLALFSPIGHLAEEKDGAIIAGIVPVMTLGLAIFLGPRMRFPEEKEGMTERKSFSLFVASFVAVGLIGLVRAWLGGLLYWNEHTITSYMALALGCSLLAALGYNKRRTSRHSQRG
jgi:uncharacterized membrane protein YesL